MKKKIVMVTLLLSALFALSGQAQDRHFREAGRATHGAFYWNGHKLMPPYIIEVGDDGTEYVWVGNDSRFRRLGRNRIPVYLPEPVGLPVITEAARRIMPKFDDPQSVASHVTVDSLAHIAVNAARDAGQTESEAIAASVAVYLNYPDVVDSVHASSRNTIVRYWRGWQVGSYFSFPPRGNRHPAPGETSANDVNEIVATLESGATVILVGNYQSTVPVKDALRFEAALDSLGRFGRPLSSTLVKNPWVTENFRRPQSLKTLIRRAGE